MNSQPPRFAARSKLAVLVCAVAVLGAVASQQTAIADWLKLRGYTPPAAISQLAGQTQMTAAARHLFYLNKPSVDAKADFSKACPGNTEKTIVLGCYVPDEAGIHVLQVSDGRLQGVEQVTAAHETLHAAYQRLSSRDKQSVNAMLQDYAAHGLTDQRIKDTLKDYQTSEPGQQLNEMHSIFGTEISHLPPALESYYRRYFSNRQIVAGYAAQYQAAFTSRRQQVAQDDAQLQTWKRQIDAEQADLVSKDKQLQAQSDRMNRERSAGEVAASNAEVPSYNAGVTAYNAGVDKLKADIAQYNRLVDTRNALALETQQLQRSLSGDLPPANK